jgi:PAS domain S-box-containing protein
VLSTSGSTALLAQPARGRMRLRPRVFESSRARLGGAIALVVLIEILRLIVGNRTGTGVSMLLVLPVAIIGIDRGIWAGAMAGVMAYVMFLFWVITDQVVGIEATGHATRGGLYLLMGVVAGWAAEHLRHAEARQRQLADALGDMVSVLDANARYLYVSGAVRDLLGYQPRELIGTSAYDYFHPEDATTVGVNHGTVSAGSAPQTAVYRVRRADGRYAWLETVTRVIRERGELVEMLCSSRDVTLREVERMAAEEDIEQLRRQVQRVLDYRGIEPVFQRIVALGTGVTVGYEALARFPLNPSRPPNVWFEQAARVGLGQELELLAIERALESFDSLPAAAWLSVNASPATLAAPGLMDIIGKVPAARLIIEVTEHAQIEDYEAFNAVTTDLRSRGVRLAIDDAGAGFASLRHILDIRPDVIKLDMSLTRHIDRDPARRALATALRDFADSLEANVIAEGIEDREELDELLLLGIHQGQGYLLGRPGRLDEAS